MEPIEKRGFFDIGGYRVALKKSRLLVVDDDPDILAFIDRIVQSIEGFEPPLKANSYEDALLLATNTDIDLIICDYDLGIGNGLDVIQRAKAHHPGIKSVLLTAHDKSDILTSALKSGVDHYLKKPCEIVDVQQALRLLRDSICHYHGLKDALDQYTSLVDAIPDIVYKINEDGIIVFINNAVKSLGYTPEELLGQHIRVLIHPDDYHNANSHDVLDQYKNVTTGDARAPKLVDERRTGDRMTKNLYLRIVNKSNRFSSDSKGIEVSINAYGEVSSTGVKEDLPRQANAQFVGTVGLIRDISVRRQVERELVENRIQMDEAIRVKGEFLANMSHETRTPMNSILGMSELLMHMDMNEEQTKCLKHLISNAEALKGILDDLLDLSRSEHGNLMVKAQYFKVQDIAQPLQSLFVNKAQEKSIHMSFEVKEPEIGIYGDLKMLQQVLSKLLSNALKFTDEGSIQVDIHLDRDKGTTPYLQMSVVDTGIGIPPHQMDNIFEKFTQGDGSATRHHGGTGIGLALCRDLTELMGGEIQAQSEPGQGARFNISVPVDESMGSEGVQQAEISSINCHLLVINESREEGDRIVRRLRRYGIKGELALEASEAIKTFMVSPVQGVMISDGVLNENRGLIRELRKFFNPDHELPVFLIHKQKTLESFPELNICDAIPASFRPVEVMPVFQKWKHLLEVGSSSNADDLLSEFGLD